MILFASLFTLILTILLYVYNFKINRNTLYLCISLITLSISGILHHYFILSESKIGITFFYGHFMPLLYITGPMLYFYIIGVLKDSFIFKKSYLWHFIPFIIALISIFPYYFVSWEDKLEIGRKLIENPNLHKQINISWLYNNSYNLAIRPFILLFYVIISMIKIIIYLLKNSAGIKGNYNHKKTTIWLFFITITIGVCAVSYALLTINYFTNPNITRTAINGMTINFLSGISYSFIPVLMMIFPEVLYGIPRINELEPKFTNKIFDKKNSKVESENDELEKTADIILDHIKAEKPYLNPNFSLDDLAKQLNIPKHHLYYCFNIILKTKFTTIRTQFRIEHAKESLLKGELEQVSMEGIWTNAGFTSKTNFFVTFKEITGITPLEYVKINKLD